MIEAKVVADSINPQGDRLTTFVVTYPRIIHSEVMTHRMFSRNSASSRAIPFAKMVESVHSNPFIPIAWQKDHNGMQGTEYLSKEDADFAETEWLIARDCAIRSAEFLNDKEINNVTKQLCNRLLEPFMWHTVIITSGKEGLDNFFKLRDHEAAEIHIQELARRMKEAINNSTPKQLQAGEWHIPFSDNLDIYQLRSLLLSGKYNSDNDITPDISELKLKIATARCARVSYTVVGEEGKEANYINDIKLHDRLAESGHWSCFEHCSRVMSDDEYKSYWKSSANQKFKDKQDLIKVEGGWCRNFKGFIQYRELVS
jgi:thymidylate synthase ThyX